VWAAWLCDTRTGLIGPQVPLATGGSWDVTLNDIDAVTLNLADGWLDTIPTQWWREWQGSILLAHTCGIRPVWEGWVFGPITNRPSQDIINVDENTKLAVDSLPGAGMREMLKYRIATAHDWNGSNLDAIKNTQIQFTKMALGTIQEELVKLACAKTAGNLPVRFNAAWRQADMPNDDGHTKTYDGFNVSNNDIDKLIDDLSNYVGGPDFMLRAGMDTPVDDVWRAYVLCVHGLEDQPWLPQEQMLIWDTTAPDSPFSRVEVTTNAATTTRQWATGAGDGAGVLIEVAQNDALIQSGMPLLESVGAYQSVSIADTLQRHAQADLAAVAAPRVQVNVTVQADHPASVLGSWHVGDRVQLVVAGQRNLSAGTHLMTVISASGSPDSESVDVSLQED